MAEEQPQPVLAKALKAMVITPAVLAMGAFLAGTLVFLTVALLERRCAPMNLVIVQQFEVSPELVRRLSLSGKSASDLVIDSLNRHVAQGSQFHGAEYFAYDASGTQSIALQRSIKIPVQSSYGIEVKGISIDNLIQIYNRIRYKEWLISGDVTSSGERVTARLRLNRSGAAKYWEASDDGRGDVTRLIAGVMEAMLADENPELLGRSYLQQHEYPRAEEVFRRWGLSSPRDWRPSYYLSLAYDYQGKEREALCIARWSRRLAAEEKRLGDASTEKKGSSDPGNSADLAEVTLAVSEMNGVSTVPATSPMEARQRLLQVEDAEQHLSGLLARNKRNMNYSVQLARVLDREAEVESESLSQFEPALERERRAIALVEEAIEQTPENGGLYEQKSIFLQRLVAMARQQKRSEDEIAPWLGQETEGFRRALELNPGNRSPLWGAVYGLIDLHKPEKAVEVAYTVMLLLPDSTTAQIAYVVALEHAGKPGEAGERLLPLLAKADESELQTLWECFRNPGESHTRRMIGQAGRRRFPHNRAFSRS